MRAPVITTKTADRLDAISREVSAIADAVYEAGHHRLGNEIGQRASDLNAASRQLQTALENYARAAMPEPSQ